MDGWTVSRRSSGKIRFKKKSNKRRDDENEYADSDSFRTEQIDVDLEQFVRNNTQTDRLFNNR